MGRPLPRTVLAGRYQIEAALGSGGAGSVFRVFDRQRGAVCALKMLHPWRSAPDNLTRFKREFRAASRLDHPHCLRVHALECDDQQWFYTMDFVAGGSLRIERHHRWQDLVPVALQILAGLDHIHAKQIVHRDIKPQNVLIERLPGQPPQVKLADFGISMVSEVDQAPIGQVIGSLAYLAPEQLEGGPVDPRADLYALGLVLYEALSGRNPVRESLHLASRTTRLTRGLAVARGSAVMPPLAAVAPGVPPALAAIVMRLLSAAPDARYPTAALVHDDLTAWWSGSGGFQPTGETSTRTYPLARAAHLAAPRLVGRARELQLLADFCAQATSASREDTPPFVCFIEGPAGTGKSRLVREIIRGAITDGMQVEAGTWQTEGGGRWPLGWMFRGAATIAAGPAVGGDTPSPECTLESAQSVGPGTPDQMTSDHGDGQWHLHRQIADALVDRSLAQPLLVVLEDAHWADAPSLLLLTGLLRSLAQARHGSPRMRIALVVTHRPTPASGPLACWRATARQLGVAREVVLPGLNAEQAGELVASMLMCPVSEAVRAFVDRLLLNREANPLYLGQTLHLLLSTGALARRGSTWDLGDRALAGARLPETVTEAIGERAVRLSAEAKRLLATAAVLGREFGLALLQEAVRMDQGMVLDCLDEAIRAGFVLEGEAAVDAFLFTHDRFREAIDHGLSEADRADLHRRAANAIERQHTHEPEWSGRLAYHHGAAGAPDRAHHHSRRAAQHAASTSLFAQAAEHYGNARRFAVKAQLAVPPELVELHADACLQSGRYDEALNGFVERLQGVHEPIARTELLRKCAELEFRRGNNDHAEALLEEVLRALGLPTPPRRAAVAPGQLMMFVWMLTRLAPRRTYAPRLPPSEVQRTAVFVRTGLWLGEVLFFRDWGRACFYGMSALRAARSLGSCAELSMVTAAGGLVASAAGARAFARLLHNRAHIHLQGGSANDRAWIHVLRALSASCHGDVPEALADLKRAEDILTNTKEPLRLREVLALRGDLHGSLGDFASMQACAERTLRLADELQDNRGRGWGLYLKGRLASRLGRHEEARGWLASAATHAEQAGDVTYKLNCDASRAFDLLMTAEIDEAMALASAASAECARRHLVHPMQAADGVLLAAGGLLLARDGRLPRELVGQVRRVRLLHWHRARCMALTRPIFMAGNATLAAGRGKLGSSVKLFAKAARTAERAGQFGTLLDICALASRALPPDLRAQYADRHARLRDRLRVAPAHPPW
jgi:tetratricopeptide (TPR) repeat protein